MLEVSVSDLHIESSTLRKIYHANIIHDQRTDYDVSSKTSVRRAIAEYRADIGEGCREVSNSCGSKRR